MDIWYQLIVEQDSGNLAHMLPTQSRGTNPFPIQSKPNVSLPRDRGPAYLIITHNAPSNTQLCSFFGKISHLSMRKMFTDRSMGSTRTPKNLLVSNPKYEAKNGFHVGRTTPVEGVFLKGTPKNRRPLCIAGCLPHRAASAGLGPQPVRTFVLHGPRGEMQHTFALWKSSLMGKILTSWVFS